ncbi:hypothetical protein GJ496_008784 [Pomphorhynchus laevis]|nr:hypothetical protein GJ496_008784 [Pomphorhynchus laevis]
MAKIRQAVANATVKNTNTNQEIQLKSLWAEKPCVITFLRRLGCRYCRVGARELSEIKPFLEVSNFKLIGVCFDSFGIEEFKNGEFFEGDLYLDETRSTYKALNFKRSNWLKVFKKSISTYFHITRKAKSLNITGNFKGDGLQLGGTVAVAVDDTLLYSFSQSHISDELDVKALCQSLDIQLTVNVNAEHMNQNILTGSCARKAKWKKSNTWTTEFPIYSYIVCVSSMITVI